MSTTVYLPENKNNFGGNLGAGVSTGLGDYAKNLLEREEQKRRMAEVQQQADAIRNAGSREKAMELFTTIKHPNIEAYQAGLSFLNQVWPVTDNTPTKVTKTDPNTGVKTTEYVSKKDLLNTSDTEPQMAHFFNLLDKKALTVQDLGKLPFDKRPKGSITEDELKQMQVDRTQKEKEKNTTRQALTDRIATTRQFYNSLVGILPANVKKVNADGSFTVDFTANPKIADAYKKTLENQDELLKEYNGNFTKAVAAGLQKYGANDRPEEPPPPAPAAPKGGIASSLKSGFKDLLTNLTAPKKSAAPEAKPIARPTGVPANAKYSPSQKSWWWQDSKGNWQSSKGK